MFTSFPVKNYLLLSSRVLEKNVFCQEGMWKITFDCLKPFWEINPYCPEPLFQNMSCLVSLKKYRALVSEYTISFAIFFIKNKKIKRALILV